MSKTQTRRIFQDDRFCRFKLISIISGRRLMEKSKGGYAPQNRAKRNGAFSNPMLIGIVAGAGVLLAIRYRKELKPCVRSALREFYGFRDWLFENAEEVKSDMEDLVAEAKESFADQIARDLNSVEKERAILKRIEILVKAKENKNA